MSGGAASPADPDAVARAASTEVLELALWMGQLLMDNGAESERVEQTVRACGEHLGGSFGAVLVTYEAILVGEPSAGGRLARMRKVRPVTVNMSMIEKLSHVSHRVQRGELRAPELRSELERIERAPRHYSPFLGGVAVALACAAFSRLFQCDWGAFLVTFAGAGAAMLVRHFYQKRLPNRLFFASVSAAVASFVVGALDPLFAWSATPGPAIVASALMLVPGVPSINAVQDMIKGHLGVAVARAFEAVLIIVSATLGLLLGIGLSQVRL
jgi:uncharacterized membrane protein YjjP (DUF1212 family)